MESRLVVFQSASETAELQITELQAEKEAAEQEMKKLVESHKEVDSDRERIASSESELASLTTERDTLKETVVEMESQLAEFQSWSDAAQEKLKELQDEKESVELEMKKLTESEKEADTAIVDGLRDEITSSKSELASLTAERDTLKETIVEMESQLTEFQSWSDVAQQKLTELEGEKNAVVVELEALVQSEKDAKEQLDSFRENMELKSTELSAALQENDELKSVKADLESQLERTKLEYDNLYGKNSSLEQDLKVLETQCSDLVEKTKRAEALVNEKEEVLRDAETNATELQFALETLQAESTGVVDEWKGGWLLCVSCNLILLCCMSAPNDLSFWFLQPKWKSWSLLSLSSRGHCSNSNLRLPMLSNSGVLGGLNLTHSSPISNGTLKLCRKKGTTYLECYSTNGRTVERKHLSRLNSNTTLNGPNGRLRRRVCRLESMSKTNLF
jgi:predicted  nucleic acid-binding Zn-ribbon protein